MVNFKLEAVPPSSTLVEDAENHRILRMLRCIAPTLKEVDSKLSQISITLRDDPTLPRLPSHLDLPDQPSSAFYLNTK